MTRTLQYLVIACSEGGILSGCSNDKSMAAGGALAAATPATRTRTTTVDVFEVEASTTVGEQLIPAVISVENTAMVLAQRDGILTELGGQEGTRVAKGDVMGRLNDDDQRAQLRQVELEVNRSKLEERQLEALVKVNRSELDEEMELAKDGLSSKRQVNRAQLKLDANLHELERVRLGTETAAARVEAIKIELEKASIRAPFAGIVTHRYGKRGASVVKNDKLFEISQLEPLEVKFQLPQTEGTRLRKDQILALSLADSGRVVARARIRRQDPIADAASNTLGYLADVLGRERLIPGVAVNVHVPNIAATSSFRVPRTAFTAGTDLRRGAASALLVIDGDKCSARTVWVNAIEGNQVEIGSGLNAGDRVILAPPPYLKPGEVVTAKR